MCRGYSSEREYSSERQGERRNEQVGIQYVIE